MPPNTNEHNNGPKTVTDAAASGASSKKKSKLLSHKDIEHLAVLGRAVLVYKGRLWGAFISSIAVALLSVGSITAFKPILDIIFGTADFTPPVTVQVAPDAGAIEGVFGFPGFNPEDVELKQDGPAIEYRAQVPEEFRDDPKAAKEWLSHVYTEQKKIWLHRSASTEETHSSDGVKDRLRTLLQPLYAHLSSLMLDSPYKALGFVALLLVILTCTKGIAAYAQEYLTHWIGRRVVADLREKLYDHIMGMDLAFFQRRKVGSLMSYLTIDVELFGNSTMAVFGRMLQEPFIILGFVILLLAMNPLLTLLYAAVLPILGWIMTSFGKKIRKARRKSQDAISTMSGILQETMTGVRVVRAFQMEDIQRKKFAKENESIFRAFMRLSRIRALSSPLIESLASLGVACILMIGGWAVFHRGMEASSFMVYLIALGSLYQPIKRLNKAYESIQQGLAGADRIFDILELPPLPPQKPGVTVIKSFDKGLAFHSVRHRYEDGPWVLEDISFEIPKGKVTALVGPSGAGKSTLAAFVPRLIDPAEGSITIDGIDLHDVDVNSLRSQIGLVPQEIALFHDSVANNVSCGLADATEDQIREALVAAQAWSFVESLPEGIYTEIGERATLLSGGQAQRVAVARAFYRNSPILILDEATSSLDAASEELVRQALDRLMRDRTVLVIAHRLSTVINADQIVVLEQGRIVGKGRHGELLDTCPTYEKLFKLQFSKQDNQLDSKEI